MCVCVFFVVPGLEARSILYFFELCVLHSMVFSCILYDRSEMARMPRPISIVIDGHVISCALCISCVCLRVRLSDDFHQI